MFFSFGKSHFLGIDFGTSLIKAVELTLENGEPKLTNYGQVDLADLEQGKVSSGHSYDEEVVLYLQALLNRFHPKSHSAYVAMPAFIGLISLIELPEMKEDELQEAIRFEAHKYIPSALEDVALSWEIVGMRPAIEGGESAKMEILLVAALNKEVGRYRKYVEDVHLKMEFLELETFSLVRSIVGKAPGLHLVIDIGSRATNLVLVDEGLVKMSRNLDTGGRDVTRTLTEGLDITVERAEALKKSGKDFLNVPEAALIFPALQLIANEVERILASYQKKYPEKKCDGIILSGGTAHLTGLPEYYSKLFHLPVSVGDPWHRIKYHPKLAPDIQKLGASFSVALGLALAGIDALTPKKESFQKSFSWKDFLHKKL